MRPIIYCLMFNSLISIINWYKETAQAVADSDYILNCSFSMCTRDTQAIDKWKMLVSSVRVIMVLPW